MKNGSLAASTVLGTPAAEPRMMKFSCSRLDATNTAGGDPDTLANLLNGIPTNSQRGQRLLPALASALRRPAPTPSTPHNIGFQCNVEKDAGIKIAYQIDGNPSLDLLPNTSTTFTSLAKLLTVKVKRGVSAFLEHLINAFRRGSPPPLSERWANTPTALPKRRILQILLSILRDMKILIPAADDFDTCAPAPFDLCVSQGCSVTFDVKVINCLPLWMDCPLLLLCKVGKFHKVFLSQRVRSTAYIYWHATRLGTFAASR